MEKEMVACASHGTEGSSGFTRKSGGTCKTCLWIFVLIKDQPPHVDVVELFSLSSQGDRPEQGSAQARLSYQPKNKVADDAKHLWRTKYKTILQT